MTAMAATGSLRHGQALVSDIPGMSDPAGAIKRSAEELSFHFRQSQINKTPLDLLEEELQMVLFECFRPGWDGYEARPVSIEAAKKALAFMEALGNCVALPEVVPEPDGEIALEWCGAAGDLFSISFGEGDQLTYAGRFKDGGKAHGVEPLAENSLGLLQGYISRIR